VKVETNIDFCGTFVDGFKEYLILLLFTLVVSPNRDNQFSMDMSI